MNHPIESLQQDLDVLRQTWTDALPAGEVDGPVASMSDAGLVATVDALARHRRHVESVIARLAGEVARRSPAEAGREGLAKKQGFVSPVRMIATATGGAAAEAGRMVSVGKATAPRQALTGEALPPKHPHVADALESGLVSLEAAAAITTMLDRVAPRADAGEADAVEKILAKQAGGLSLDRLQRVIKRAEAHLDQDGVEPREEELRANRSLSFRQDGHGMVHVSGRLDPETAAPVKAAVEAIVTHEFRSRQDPAATDTGTDTGADTGAGGPGTDAPPVLGEDRSVAQMQADALALIAGHVLGCHEMPQAPSTTLVVRTDLHTLTEGVGYGTIDGLDQPVSAGTLRRMAASAGIIPAVLGTESLPLDVGRAARLFTPAQRIALAERDGGCACCGRDVSYVQAHHIRWWERDTGPTDLNNGVLLCPPCHATIHADGWGIRIRDGNVWFIPPPHVDPDQRPRLGGKARYDLPRTINAA